MSTETVSEDFPLTQARANQLLSDIAETIVHYLRTSDLLRVYEGIDSLTEVKSVCDDTDLDNVFYDFFANNEDAWETLLRKPFMKKLAEIMKEN